MRLSIHKPLVILLTAALIPLAGLPAQASSLDQARPFSSTIQAGQISWALEPYSASSVNLVAAFKFSVPVPAGVVRIERLQGGGVWVDVGSAPVKAGVTEGKVTGGLPVSSASHRVSFQANGSAARVFASSVTVAVPRANDRFVVSAPVVRVGDKDVKLSLAHNLGPAREVLVEAKQSDGSWGLVARHQLPKEQQAVTLSVPNPGVATTYRVRAEASWGWGATVSNTVAVKVVDPVESLAVSVAPSSMKDYSLGFTLSRSGTHSRPIVAERLVGSMWETVRTWQVNGSSITFTLVNPKEASRYRFTLPAHQGYDEVQTLPIQVSPDKISESITGKHSSASTASSAKSVTVRFDRSEPQPRPVWLQVAKSGKWVTVHTGDTGNARVGYVQITNPRVTSTYRFHFPETATQKAVSTKSFPVKITKSPTSLYSYGAVHTAVGAKRSMTVYSYGAEDQKLSVQQKVGSKWVTQGSMTVKKGSWSKANKVTFKPPTKRGTYTFRAVLSAGKYSDGSTVMFKVHNADNRKYGSYIAKARSAMKKYCPSTPIYIASPGQARGTWGQAYSADMSILLSPGIPSSQLSRVAKHECSHIVQFRKFYSGDDKTNAKWAKHQREGNKVFASRKHSPLETEADCMTNAWFGIKSSSKNSYQKSCSSKQLAHAKKTLTRKP